MAAPSARRPLLALLAALLFAAFTAAAALQAASAWRRGADAAGLLAALAALGGASLTLRAVRTALERRSNGASAA